ncbi:MAG: DUF2791 family P-loop domain-containing protein, partial [Thermoplasmata archaeon]
MAPRFVGREKELDILKKGLEHVKSGEGRFFLITGERGIGKTRLLQEFARIAVEQGALVMENRCGGGAPYSVVENAITRATKTALEPLPLGLALSEGREAGETVYRARTMILERFLRKFEEISSAEECVLLLDDLQWADTGTLNFLHYLSRNLGKLRIFVACAYGSEYTKEESGFTQFLRNLNIERNTRTIMLGNLTQAEAAKIICESLGGWKIHRKVIEEIYRKTGGNPFFIEEFCKVLGEIASQAELEDPKFGRGFPLPEGIKNLINYRLNGLGEEELKVLRCCAVLGNSFEYEVLKMVVEFDDEENLLDAIEKLIRAGYLKEEQEERYSFTQNLVREVVYEDILLPRKKFFHKKVAGVLESKFGEDIKYAGTIGKHYLLAGEVEKGCKFIISAAENSLRNYLIEDALAYAEDVVSVVGLLEENETKRE